MKQNPCFLADDIKEKLSFEIEGNFSDFSLAEKSKGFFIDSRKILESFKEVFNAESACIKEEKYFLDFFHLLASRNSSSLFLDKEKRTATVIGHADFSLDFGKVLSGIEACGDVSAWYDTFMKVNLAEADDKCSSAISSEFLGIYDIKHRQAKWKITEWELDRNITPYSVYSYSEESDSFSEKTAEKVEKDLTDSGMPPADYAVSLEGYELLFFDSTFTIALHEGGKEKAVFCYRGERTYDAAKSMAEEGRMPGRIAEFLKSL